MNLLKWLLLDWKELGQKKADLNIFAISFLSLPTQYYHHMQLDLHCSADRNDRGGSLEDACHIIVLILTRHLSEDGEHAQPVTLDELMSNPRGQQEFEIWSARNTPASIQELVKKNTTARQSELTVQQRQETMANKAMGVSEEYEEDLEEGDETETENHAVEGNDDAMMAFRKHKKTVRKDLKEAAGHGDITATAGGPAERWEDSQLAREQRARAAQAARAGIHETVRDSQEAAQEAADREEEKARALSKDPLGIVDTDDFDIRHIERSQAEIMEQALHDLLLEVQQAEATGVEELITRVVSQKESLEAMVELMGGIEGMENTPNLTHSVVPTSHKFDPVLFLTLVHRTTSYDELTGSLQRLTNKTENQAEQLQNLVRDNFPLFVRCAEGFEDFRQKSESEVGPGVHDRIDKLEAIAESGAYQAKKSFKPLLDNTSEVRKVQSALSVLQRTAPILQVPSTMRQHVENRRYSEALKAYRRVLVIDDSCKIKLFVHVKSQAEECVREARRELERRLAQADASVDELTDGIRHLGELLALDIPPPPDSKGEPKNFEDGPQERRGIYEIGESLIRIRDHPPALACLLLQAAHFAERVKGLITAADESCGRIFSGESLSQVHDDFVSSDAIRTPAMKASGKQWKYDVLDARVLSTVDAVGMVRVWLPRLLRVGNSAREDEKRRAARVGMRSHKSPDIHLSAFEVFVSNVAPSLHRLVEHASFCAIGSTTRSGGKDIASTFGQNVDEKLRALLRSPLPPSQSTKVGKELAELVDILVHGTANAENLRPESDTASVFKLSPLEDSKALADSAVITIEKRRCIYAFDVCGRACSNRASGSGKFDTDSLLGCLQILSEQLSRPDECSNEVEKGCELVVRRCCEGLASYVRDRDDLGRLSAVSECADIVANRLEKIIGEASFLTPNTNAIQDAMMEDIMGLESLMFDEYLENIRMSVASSTRIAWLDIEADSLGQDGDSVAQTSFPSYLSASLLAIVRCRAQVEQTLGDKVRRSEGVPYQHLSMSTVADGVVEGICNEVMQRKLKLKVRQADRLANELEFVRNTLNKFLNGDVLSLLDSTLQMVSSKAGRGRDFQRDGPEGLAALEELERLGRVYVMCLNE
jgi:hypothetical protein